MIDEVRQWRIDALDVRGGLAFASQRDGRFSEIAHNGANPLCVFIGAPGFQPEIVVNRSVALASIRGAFQFRLYVKTAEGSEEVAFPTLDAVAQFVRRAFLRSGGGDGAAGEGGEGPTPLPPDSGPDLPRVAELIEASETLANLIAGAALLFNKESGNCKPGDVALFSSWPGSRDWDSSEPKNFDGGTILANAALALMREMLRRMPDGTDPRALMNWHREARGFGQLVGAMGIWPILSHRPYRTAIGKLMKQLALQRSRLAAIEFLLNHVAHDEDRGIWLSSLLFGTTLPLDDDRSGAAVPYGRYWEYYVAPIETGAGLLDPIAGLGRIPCPDDLAKKVRDEAGDTVSLYHALASFVGSPPMTGAIAPRLLEQILFAATWIATSADRGVGQRLGPFLDEPRPSTIDAAIVQDKLDRGWNWLRIHLPHLCFEPRVETAISDAANLVYPSEGPTASTAS